MIALPAAILVGFWLGLIVVFGAVLPSQLPRDIDQGALALHVFGFRGTVIGAVTGARCLRVWTIPREAPRPEAMDLRKTNSPLQP